MATGLKHANKRWSKYWKGVKRPASETVRDWAPIGLGVLNLGAGLYTSSKNREADEKARQESREDLAKYRGDQLQLQREEQGFRESEALKDHAREQRLDFQRQRDSDLERDFREEQARYAREGTPWERERAKQEAFKDFSERARRDFEFKETMNRYDEDRAERDERYDEDRAERERHNKALEEEQRVENEIRAQEAEQKKRTARGDDKIDDAVRAARLERVKVHNDFDTRARRLAAHLNAAEKAGFIRRNDAGELEGTNDPIPGYIVNDKTREAGTGAMLANEAKALEADRASLPSLDDNEIRRQVDPRIEEHEQMLQHYAGLASRAEGWEQHDQIAQEAMSRGIHPEELMQASQRQIDDDYQRLLDQHKAQQQAPAPRGPAQPQASSGPGAYGPSGNLMNSIGSIVGEAVGRAWQAGQQAVQGGRQFLHAGMTGTLGGGRQPAPSMQINPAQDYGGAGVRPEEYIYGPPAPRR